MARKRLGKGYGRKSKGGGKSTTVVSPFMPPMGKGRAMKKRGGRK